MSELRTSTRVIRLFRCLEDIERGVIHVPSFPRGDVWSDYQKISLFNSIKRGFPIGMFVFWNPKKSETSHCEIQQIGGYQLPKQEAHSYIIDGYQRLSVLLGCLVDPKTTHLQRTEGYYENGSDLCYDLENDSVVSRSNDEDFFWRIPLHELVGGGKYFDFTDRLGVEKISQEMVDIYTKRYKSFSKRLFECEIPITYMEGGDLQETEDLFSQLNGALSNL